MKVALVTGGAGFLGSHLCERFLNEGYHVIAVDNCSTGSIENIHLLEKYNEDSLRFIFIHADVTDNWEDWQAKLSLEWLSHIKYVLHFASPASPVHYQRLNVETMMVNSLGLKKALDFANAQNARLILASTSEIYGTPEVHPQPESYWGHVNSFGERSCYNESKRFAEALLYSYNKNFGLRHGLVRIFNTYGPRMDLSDGRVIIHSIRAIAQGEAVLVHGTGRQTRSFCYVSDLVEAIFRYTQSSLSEPINVGNPEEISIAHLIDSLYAFYPDQQKKITYDSISEEDPLMRRPDISKAQELLHWQPQVPLQEGLRLFKDWFEGKK